ncbi:MAG: ABC transporter permease, partial [Geminicoccales bacterium]
MASTVEIAAAEPLEARRPGFWLRLVRSPTGVVGLAIVVTLVVAAALAPAIAPFD